VNIFHEICHGILLLQFYTEVRRYSKYSKKIVVFIYRGTYHGIISASKYHSQKTKKKNNKKTSGKEKNVDQPTSHTFRPIFCTQLPLLLLLFFRNFGELFPLKGRLVFN